MFGYPGEVWPIGSEERDYHPIGHAGGVRLAVGFVSVALIVPLAGAAEWDPVVLAGGAVTVDGPDGRCFDADGIVLSITLRLGTVEMAGPCETFRWALMPCTWDADRTLSCSDATTELQECEGLECRSRNATFVFTLTRSGRFDGVRTIEDVSTSIRGDLVRADGPAAGHPDVVIQSHGFVGEGVVSVEVSAGGGPCDDTTRLVAAYDDISEVVHLRWDDTRCGEVAGTIEGCASDFDRVECRSDAGYFSYDATWGLVYVEMGTGTTTVRSSGYLQAPPQRVSPVERSAWSLRATGHIADAFDTGAGMDWCQDDVDVELAFATVPGVGHVTWSSDVCGERRVFLDSCRDWGETLTCTAVGRLWLTARTDGDLRIDWLEESPLQEPWSYGSEIVVSGASVLRQGV